MGSYVHEAAVAVTSMWRPGGLPDLDAFRAEAPEELRPLIIGPIETPLNGFVTYAFLPCGSKAGWPEAEEAAHWRTRFMDLFDVLHDDGSSSDDVVEVRFGDADAPSITATWPPPTGAR